MTTAEQPVSYMDYQEFRALTEKYLAALRRGDALTATHHLALVRIWNTIETQRLSEADEVFRDFATAYFPAHIEESARALEATLSKGMCYYSKKHDVYIGGKPHPNSEYRLTNRPGQPPR